MDTIVLTMEEAEQSLAKLICQMRQPSQFGRHQDAEGPLAYLTLALRFRDCEGGESEPDPTDPSAHFKGPMSARVSVATETPACR